MTVKCFTQYDKNLILAAYKEKMPISKIAEMFRTSTRTVGRIITEAGLALPLSRVNGEAYHVMRLLKKHGLDLKGLTDLLNKQGSLFNPNINKDTVQRYLNSSSQEELASLFYQAALVKVAEMHNVHTATATLKLQQAAEAGRTVIKEDKTNASTH